MPMDNDNSDKANHNKWIEKLYIQSVAHVLYAFF